MQEVRKIMGMHGCFNKNSNCNQLYIPCLKVGWGFQSIQDACNCAIAKLDAYVFSARSEHEKLIKTKMALHKSATTLKKAEDTGENLHVKIEFTAEG